MTRPHSRSLPAVSLFLIASCFTFAASGQQAASQAGTTATETLISSSQPTPLPDAPLYSSSLATCEGPQASSQTTSQASGQAPGYTPAYEDEGKQTKRILGIVPNFRAVSADEKLPPETVKEKLIDATEDSFDYSSIFVPAALAGYSMARKATPQFHQ